MKQYLGLCHEILKNGVMRDNRTKVPTKSIFGYQMRFNLNKSFPMITTKKLNLRSIIHELLWFIKGDTNIRYLVLHNVKIWNEWPYQVYCQSNFFQGESLLEFIQKIKEDEVFAQKHGNLGPVYGAQWRNFTGIDQLQKVISEIKTNPNSRRLLISSWNPKEINQMLLPPCHVLMQFYVQKNKLSLHLYQRSGDVFLGVPFNIASYALLLMMVAQVTDLKPYEFIHTLGDAHIYHNHFEQVKIQIKRSCYPLPQIFLNPFVKNIEDFQFTDFRLKNYISHGILNGEIAV
ncbi:thymidylate synthase [Candidatus Phytoplasma phoenicium]|uniref:Thymidylate synthase n=1 Tax=Candidatus Phytoplasma phoenicium TaxID=198422 RepID=A0A2S8NVM4_9MOLU|nr:thymidylate synthase [Candidatus Phytoplasma phoenicium]